MINSYEEQDQNKELMKKTRTMTILNKKKHKNKIENKNKRKNKHKIENKI